MSSDRFGHKDYQNEVLRSLRTYWQQCREMGDPKLAFVKATEELHGFSHDYHRVDKLQNGAEFPFDMPFVCLRVPTGGGKTVIAARAVKVYQDELSDAPQPLVLWLVPSDAIKQQTVAVMKNLEHPLRRLLEEELGAVEIFDGPEALGIQPSIIAGKATIIVSTIQAYRVEATDGRKVYGNNGSLMSHFDGIPLEVKNAFPEGFPHSLANVLRLHRPLVVVDEAHGARSNLSLETLERFQPRAILELTATPISKEKDYPPSNVLHSVSAAQLKAEEMIKLPVVLVPEPGFQELLTAAIAQRGSLEAEAKLEEEETGEYIRPILLLQAEPRYKDQPDGLTVEVLEKALRVDHLIPAEQIVVHTGDEKGLAGIDLNARDCAIRYVVTQSALKEGWDCPFAYVLCSVANLSSATAVEQMLGRILRMPQAQRKRREALNQAYAFVRSTSFYLAAGQLRDQLIKKSGYNAAEAKEFFVMREKQSAFQLEAGGQRSVTVSLPVPLNLDGLPPAVRPLVLRTEENERKVTLTGRPNKAAITALVAAVADEESKALIKAAADQLAVQEKIMSSPAERQLPFSVPQMMLELDGELFRPDEGEWLETNWKPPLPPEAADIPVLETKDAATAVGIIDIGSDGKVMTKLLPDLGKELRLITVRENWGPTALVAWLVRNVPHRDLDPDVMRAWVDAVLQKMLERNELGRLVRERFELRRKLEAKLGYLRDMARRGSYHQMLFGIETPVKVRVGEGYQFTYDPNTYPCRWICPRSSEFNKHYYESVGELGSETGGGSAPEEFQFAQWLDSRAEVQWWVRNLDRQPNHAFWLQTSTDKFYPDFVAKLKDGRILVAEYKGTDRSTNDDSKEKERLGDLWAQHSGGAGLFAMVKGLGDRERVEKMMQGGE